MSKRIGSILLSTVLAGFACRSIGPPRAAQDRFDYGDAISPFWKDQML